MPIRHAYVHVPFCRHRCGYCDFTLVAGRDDLVERYFSAIERELARVETPLALETLYLGGGTPSHLGPGGLRRLFEVLQTRLVAVSGCERNMAHRDEDGARLGQVTYVPCGKPAPWTNAQYLLWSSCRLPSRSQS